MTIYSDKVIREMWCVFTIKFNSVGRYFTFEFPYDYDNINCERNYVILMMNKIVSEMKNSTVVIINKVKHSISSSRDKVIIERIENDIGTNLFEYSMEEFIQNFTNSVNCEMNRRLNDF